MWKHDINTGQLPVCTPPDQDLVVVNGLVYFGEPQDYITRSLMLPLGPHLMNKSERRGQSNSNEMYKKKDTFAQIRVIETHPGMMLGEVSKCLLSRPST